MKDFMYFLYKNNPVFIQNVLLSLYGYQLKRARYGGHFKNKLKAFKKRETFSVEQWRGYQTTELRKVLAHAFSTVPYYHEKYKKHGFTLSNFEKFELEDLKKLPYLPKEDFRKFGKTTLLSTKKNSGTFISSSGSTGTPTSTYYSKNFMQTWYAAYESRVRNWAGVDLNMNRGMIGGKKIINKANALPPYYRFNSAEKQTYFSAYHISTHTIKNYVKGLIENNVEYMVGYAFSNFQLANLIVENKIKVPKLRAVLTSSEKLTDEMRETILKAYGCRIFDSYSGVEACGLISENIDGDFLFSPDTGILEVLDKDGNDINYGEEGEVISTGLLNFDQPLIRYKIGDRLKISKNQKTNSGLNMLKIDEISGRVEDFILGIEGRKVVRFHSLFTNIKGLIMGQVVQEKLDYFIINIVISKNYLKKYDLLIINRLKNILGKQIEIKINYVKKIPLNDNGKFQAVISKLKNE
jgi:phenylacetate-CoA ligase